MRRFRGRVWRHIPVGAEPLHLGWILRASRGRWNTRRPRLPCLYTSLTPEGAVAEFEKHLGKFNIPRRRDLVSMEISVGSILDLTSQRVCNRIGVDPAVLTGDRLSDLRACRQLAVQHAMQGPYSAILAPSASLPGALNLMIYLDHTASFHWVSTGGRTTFGSGFQGPYP